MALTIHYSPQFIESLEEILQYYDERNGSEHYSRKLLKMFHRQIRLLATMPEIGRLTTTSGIRILFVERFGIEYKINADSIIIVEIYSCQTDPIRRKHEKQ
ncbi:MAG: type II toxin-antitoxin system RelE/ParE family toxin [Bacteroidaceae bacterium]|nr:type II toxin-antitoxin system RelE/ParE family toxin [Bacteroidaceae bacterium]